MPDGYGQAQCAVRISGITHQSMSSIEDLGADNIVSPPEWNDDHVLSGGTNKQFVIRDTSQAAGLNYTTGATITVITPSSDTFIDSQSATTNNDTATAVTIGGDPADGSFSRRALFTLDGSALVGKTIYSVFFYVTKVSSNGAQQANTSIIGFRVLRAYVPSQVTWNVYSTGNNWTTAGARSTGNDISATRHVLGYTAIVTNTVNAGMAWNATSLFKECLDAGDSTIRILVHQDEVDTGVNAQGYGAIDNATAAFRPYFVVFHSP